MSSPLFPAGRRRAPECARQNRSSTALACLALLAFVLAYASPGARAEGPQFCAAEPLLVAAVPPELSLPDEAQGPGAGEWQAAAFRGLSCARCNSATHYCVLNPIRYEYACAPYGTVACISASRTHWCPSGRGCWAGRCR